MSNSDNPFSAPTTVAEPVLKSAGPKRGVAHIVRRDKASSSAEEDAAKATAIGSAKSVNVKQGVAHVVSRDLPTAFGDDSIDQLITSPALKTPQDPDATGVTPEETTAPEALGKRSGAGNQRQKNLAKAGQLGTGSIDEQTVEEVRPHKTQGKEPVSAKVATQVAPPEDPNRGFLAVRSGSDLGRRVGLIEGRTTIGRGLDCDIVLTDTTISRQHVYVERRDNVYVVGDMKSGNGTFVNERERRDEVLIVNGDSFRIGNTVIGFEGPEAQDEAGSTQNWDAQIGLGKKKGRSRQITNDEESTVAGKMVRKSPPTHLDDPVTQAPTGIVEPQQPAGQPPKKSARKPTVPPPIPESKKSVQDAAIAALSSIVNTPTPDIVPVQAKAGPAPIKKTMMGQTGLGELPNQTVPPTPSPAILYPVNVPNSGPYPPAPMNQGQAQMRPPQGQGMPGRQDSGPMGPGPAPQGMGGYPQSGSQPMHMRQGSGPMGQGAPPHMGGYGPGSVPPHMQQGPSGSMQRPMLAGSSPNMMRQGYAATGNQPRENGKLLIGFISVTLVLVVVGLLATVIGQMDEGKSDAPKQPVIVADDDKTPTDSTTNDDKTPTDLTTDDDKTPTDSTTNDDKTPTDSTTNDDKTPTDSTTNDDKPLMLASLTAGKTTLGASAWGTDETFLSSISDIQPIVEPIIEPDEEPVNPTPAIDDPGSKTVKEPATKKDPKNKRDPKNKKDPKNKRDPKNRDTRRTTKRNDNESTRRTNNNRRDTEKPSPPKAVSGKVKIARGQALSMYKKQSFRAASKRLMDAGDAAEDEGDETNKLYDLAEGYQEIGEAFNRAQKKFDQKNYAGSLKDYKKALEKDKKYARGALSLLIRRRIGQVAPSAAASYMSSKNYSEAKRAAGDAKRFGAESAVARIYSSLESTARKFTKKAIRAKKDGDTSKARSLLKEALKAAPRNSPEESKAKAELKKLKKS